MARPLDVVASVALGSAVGGVVRYLLTGAVSQRMGTAFPTGTLLVNVAGCLAIGFLMRVILDTGEFSPAARALLTTGFCGGFTTFSTFAWETIAAFEEGAVRRAGLYVGTSVVFGFLAVWIGSSVAQALLVALRGKSA